MSDEVQQFLDAEAAVTEVLGELTQLRKRVENFASAKTTLEIARKDLGEFLGQSTLLVEEAGRAVGILKSLSMPEVLARLGAFREALDSSLAKLDDRFGELASAHGKHLDESMKELRAEVAMLLNHASEKSNALLARLGEQTRDQLAEGQLAMGKHLDRMRENIDQSVNTTMTRAGETQQSKLFEFGTQQREALSEAVEQVKADVTAQVTSLIVKTEVNEQAVGRLRTLATMQLICVAVLTLGVIAILILMLGKM